MTSIIPAILIVVAVVVAVWVISIYNSLIKKRIRVEEAWSDIDVQLRRRYDLIPNFVETVKGYATHERTTLDEVMEARAKATAVNVDASNVTHEQMVQFASMQDGLSGALGRLMAVAENYPDLKASQNFSELQQELSETEDKIQASRRFYNGTVRDLNTLIEQFPSNMVAAMFSFKKREFFETAEETKPAPSVQF